MKIIFEGQPLPAPRVTKRSLYIRGKEYAVWKEALAWHLKKMLRPAEEKVHIVSVKFYREGKRTADIDNLLKGVLEAFEMAGIVKNDSEIRSIGMMSVSYDSKKPRVEIVV